MQPLPLHRTIVAVDVAGFTNPMRTLVHQTAVHEGLYEVLNQAFTEAGVNLGKCRVEDRGDGALILLPPDIPKSLLVDRLPDRLVAGLRRYNAVHSAAATVALRLVLHAGEVHQNAHGSVGPAINLAFRILDASDAKNALNMSNSVLAVIASDQFYRDVIVQDPGTAPDTYRRILVLVKETSTLAWLRLPDRPATVSDVPEAVLDLLPARDLDRLRTWLSDVAVTQLPTLVQRAGGPGVQPAPHGADAWEAFLHLADFNAGADGIPPALAFLELITAQLTGPARDQLAEWIENQSRRLRLGPAMRVRREHHARAFTDTRLHLMIVVLHDGIDPGRYLLSSWRQDDPAVWPPTRGEIREVALDELEPRVDELVLDAERAWSGHGGSVLLEFLLPRALLHLPVHRWCKEHDSGDPRPLFLDYPIVVRSLERMTSPHWHRVWHERWQAMVHDPSPDRVHFSQPENLADRHRVDAILSSTHWTLMVLNRAPPVQHDPAAGSPDELTAALRAGMPALIWHSEASSEALRDIVNWLVKGDGMNDLPQRAQACRLAPLLEPTPPFDAELVRDLVILWDDPSRVVVLDQSPGRPRL
ncbi:MAG TPA: hypothetical protein VFV67_07715 [Actinophytocola sp.]|uniref:VMAP-C domain-containing protein n=1 Tax=Actinophytocola sp. TaxID=1872138 RepID=UPI002DBF35B6|nr:hypothetical protein [Actinophytocola sp.]HEU5470525.1 hypothetical protein [Actinophytocola sp.]